MGSIDNQQNVIDSRDLIERIEELEEYARTPEEFTPDIINELLSLRKLREQLSGYGDFEYGKAIIRESCFVEYAEQLADYIGAIKADAAWPTCHIDWEVAAEALKAKYVYADFDGVGYWMRA